MNLTAVGSYWIQGLGYSTLGTLGSDNCKQNSGWNFLLGLVIFVETMLCLDNMSSA